MKLIVITLILCVAQIAQAENGKVTELTQGEYKALVHDYVANPNSWVFKGKQNVVVEFSATWCPPCKILSPVLDELAKKYSGKVVFYKVDVDKCSELAQTYGVSTVPTMLFCPADGSKPTSISGAYPREELIKVIEYVFK